MNILKGEVGLIFWIHLSFIILSYFSPFLFDWKIIIIGAGIFLCQNLFIKDCVFTAAQFGHKRKRDKSLSFHSHYLKKIGIHFDKNHINLWDKLKIKRKIHGFFLRYVLPTIILLFTIIWQILLRKAPLLF